MLRAQEELALLAIERDSCITYLEERHAAIDAALMQCQERTATVLANSTVIPPYNSFGARQPAGTAGQSVGAARSCNTVRA